MSPLEFLALMLSITAIAAAAQWVLRRRQVTALRRLAAEWRMHYSPVDRFRIAAKIAPRLPVPGAAAVRVVDLLYGIEDRHYRYMFVTEYTTGVIRTKTGIRRVATFVEPRDPDKNGAALELVMAPAELSILEQYRALRDTFLTRE
jgi:hypothetical protein